MVVKKNRSKSVAKAQEIPESMKQFIKYFRIDLKSEEEVEKLTKKERKQYECRLKRWESVIETQIDYEIWKSLSMFRSLDEAILHTKDYINELKSDPNSENKAKLAKVESDTKQMVKQMESDRQAFDDIYIPYKKQRAEEYLKIKEELENEVSTLDIKSEEDIKEEEIEVKEEYISDESNDEYFSLKEEDSIDDKSLVKKEIKSEFDVKPKIKTEIKTKFKYEIKEEIKNEIKEELTVDDDGTDFVPKIKKEYISSDEDDD